MNSQTLIAAPGCIYAFLFALAAVTLSIPNPSRGTYLSRLLVRLLVPLCSGLFFYLTDFGIDVLYFPQLIIAVSMGGLIFALTCGLNGGPLKGEGTYSAAICCNLYGKMTPVISSPFMFRFHPYLTQDGPDWAPGDAGKPPMQYIANGKDGMVAAYRYFRIEQAEQILVKLRGSARGKLLIRTAPQGAAVCEIPETPCRTWTEFSGRLHIQPGDYSLYFCYEGKGRLDLAEFSFA